MKTTIWIAWSLALCLAPNLAYAEDESALTLRTERAVVFKDGYGLVVKTAHGVVGPDGVVYTDEVPDSAILGCFWATAKDGSTLAMKAGWHETRRVVRETTPCLDVLELLRANVGERLTLIRSNREDVTGVVVELLELPASAAVGPPAGGVGEFPLRPTGGQLVVVDRGDAGRLVLPVSQISSLGGAELVTTIERKTLVVEREKRLEFVFDPARAGDAVELSLLYFSEGLRWIPTYRVALDDASEAVVSLQGELLNEVEDLRDVELNLVVGVPNFRFKSVASPLTLEGALRGLLQRAAPGIMGQGQLSNALYTQRAGELHRPGARGSGDADLAPELAGADGQQDLFVYEVPHFTLERGSRATVPLWTTRVGYRHVYTLDLQIVRNSRSGSWGVKGQQHASPLKLARNEVWHQIELKNGSQVPWTTGAAMVTRGGIPLGQELLTYTSVGGCTLLPITVAVDLRGTYAEEELAREANALNWSGHRYGLIKKRATLSLSNFREQSATVRVRLSLGGRVTQLDNDGTSRINDNHIEDWADHAYGAVNNHSDLTWELELEAGGNQTLTAEFEFYTY